MFRVVLIASALLLFVRCIAGTDAGKKQYACVSDADCAEGFVCGRTSRVCEASTGGTSGGMATAGGTTAGGGESGGGASGGATAGGGTAGGATAGGGRAGGGAAGGAAAPNGTPCTTGAQCLSALCVDNTCCGNACSGPCESCNQPGFLGQCRAAPLGTTPSPACSGSYACNGSLTTCPTACTSDAGCVAARCASDGVCLPKVETLKDDFNAGLDAGTWSFGDPNCRVIDGRLHASSVAGSGAYPVISSVRRYDFTDSSVSVELVDAGDQSLPTFEAYLGSVCDPASNRCLSLLANSGSLVVELKDGSNFSTALGPVALGTWRFYRMREAGGTLVLEGSVDGGSHTQLGTTSTPFITDFRDVYLRMGAGAYGAEATATTAVYDHLNLP